MGTRHRTAVIKDGVHKIAQYGQWDGYPQGAGENILQFLQEPGNLEGLRANVDRLHFATEEEIRVIERAKCPNLVGKDWMSSDEAAQWKLALPSLSRDVGSDILNMVAYNEPEFGHLVQDSWEFGADSMFCEWAYVLDLDTDTLEVYQGFQQEPHTQGRWAFVPRTESPYRGVKLINTFTFTELIGMEPDNFVRSILDASDQ